MPRTARERSNSGTYHIMLRGTNRQEIFHDEEDCMRFLETLNRYKRECKIKVYCWCLMGNHVHLLLQEGKEDLSLTMKRIGVSFAWFYNWKYKTTGHLFQDRYKSEKIENDGYLMAVVRYIHLNPVKAGLVKKPGDWRWSSNEGYYGNKCYPPFLLDSNLLLDYISEDRNTAIRKFMEYNEEGSDEQFLDESIRIRLTDEEVRKEIQARIGDYKITEVKSLSKSNRDDIVARVKKIDGATQRQISRILGISLSLINRA